MTGFNVKSLDNSLNMILKSKNRQFMLSQIRTYSQFTDYLTGQSTVQAITATRGIFTAILSPHGEDGTCFTLTPQEPRPTIQVGEPLLLLFQSDSDAAISQATVTALMGLKVRVSSVDPRSNFRYKTRMRTRWYPLTEECWNKFNERKWTIVRQHCAPQNDSRKPPSSEYLIREFAMEIGSNTLYATTIHGDANTAPAGLLVDLSLGGFCMMTANDELTASLKSNFFFYIEIPLPHVVHDYKIGLFAVVRQVRLCESWAVLHCMFIDRLPTDTLILG